MFLLDTFKRAVEEDAPFGDLTSESLLSNEKADGYIVAGDGGVMAGRPIFEAVMEGFSIEISQVVRDGNGFKTGDIVAILQGKASDILLIERTLLNLLGRACGIATLTSLFVKRAHPVPIYDTRKTLPLWRRLDKYAVRMGGGYNHRMGLSDVAMIKDNHKRLIGSLKEAVLKFRRLNPHAPLVVEVENEEELRSLEGLSVEWVLLDNMDVETLRYLIPLARDMGFKVEISGGVTLENVGRYASLKPDRISVGALTKSPPHVDFSLEIGS
ncbi:MAG: carboxylating nicotinate-nucleotide diphosphorylase [Thermotogae bacterium]|nr:carboxylating nicotinate-nucleotide diphosphorylase [Thermotogota bacterium]